MPHDIEQLINRLSSVPFFNRVGSEESTRFGACAVVPVRTWDEAVRKRGSNAASNAFAEARGRLTRKLSADFRKEYRSWNEIARSNRETLEVRLFPRVDETINSIPELRTNRHSHALVADAVRWDILHFAAEQAYSQLVEPELYSLILQVYESGRFPCLWDEKWPNGTLWIY